MQQTIESARGILIRFLPPTNHLGARVKLADTRGIIEKPKTLPYAYEEQGAIGTACRFLREQGWNLDGAKVVSLNPSQIGGTLLVLGQWTGRDSWEVVS